MEENFENNQIKNDQKYQHCSTNMTEQTDEYEPMFHPNSEIFKHNLENIFYRTVLCIQRSYDLSSGLKSKVKNCKKSTTASVQEMREGLLNNKSLVKGLIHRCQGSGSEFGYVPFNITSPGETQEVDQNQNESESIQVHTEEYSKQNAMFYNDELDTSLDLDLESDTQEEISELDSEPKDSDDPDDLTNTNESI